jgi:hypothetical protein
MHNEQFNFPNDFMQLIAFPCQTILTFIILRSSLLVGLLLSCSAVQSGLQKHPTLGLGD